MSGRERAQSTGTVPETLIAAGERAPRQNGLAREQVAEIQRARMLAAMVELVAEHGAGNVPVAHIVARSGVSRRTFYEIFSDRDDCFLAAFDAAVGRIASVVVPAYRGPSRWRERVRAALTAALGFLDDELCLGRLLVVESLAAGPRALEQRQRVFARIVDAIDEGRGEAKKDSERAPLTAEGIAGAVCSVIHSRLVENGEGGLIELVNPLMSMIVLPYLGAAAARSELERPVPTRGERSPRSAADPLRELGMRLTYRTVRVLMTVAANPGSSNRVVADDSGIADQGQISKLLARLHGLGLIANTGAGAPARGEPNAWVLTGKGWEIRNAIVNQTSA
jgi:AcrR family transcriptional regulator